MNLYRAFFLKNLTSFLLPMLVPLLLLGSLATFVIQQYVKENINKENTNLLTHTKDHLSLIFDELDSLNMYIVASATEFINLQQMLNEDLLDQEEAKSLASLKNFIDSPNIARPYIDSIYIYLENEKEQFITSTTGGIVKVEDYFDKKWLQSYKKYDREDETWTEARKITETHPHLASKTVDLITMYRKLPNNDGIIVLNVRTDYIQERLNAISTSNNQNIVIIDRNDRVIFESGEKMLNESTIEQLLARSRSYFTQPIDDEVYIISKLYSNQYGWTYLSITPRDELYELPKRLTKIVLLLSIISVVASAAIALFLTKKNMKDVKTMILLLQAAEEGKPLPPSSSMPNDVYNYIIHTILKSFAENNNLKAHIAESKYKEQAIEFTALQSQLNPHFLYNTLETLNWKAIGLTGKPNELNSMIDNLASILRFSLNNDRMVTLLEEIKYTNSYIEIQKIRYQNQFHVQWEYDKKLNKHQVKKLIFQPFIENALTHAFQTSKPLSIKIKIRESANAISVRIIDNGKGIAHDELRIIRQRLKTPEVQTEHIGLANTYRRLQITYGNAFSFTIQSKEQWGTIIQIVFPK